VSEKSKKVNFTFSYGELEDGSIWIEPPSGRLFRIDKYTLGVILDLERGLSKEEVLKKYHLTDEELEEALRKFSLEKAIVNYGEGKINYRPKIRDISLKGFFLVFIILWLIQLEYFRYFAHTFSLNSWQDSIIIIVAGISAIFFHELGHYLVARKYFKPKFGFCFLFIFPAVYVDTQKAWTLPRNIRILINSAGIFADFVINVLVVTLVVNFPRWERLVTPFLITQYTRLSLVVNPLFTTDGYWILSDLTKTVNLRKVAIENLKRLKFNLFSFYGILSIWMMVVSILGVIWLIFNIFKRAILRLSLG